MTRTSSAPRFVVMTWLTLLLIGIITGDFVEDLVFEPAELSDSAVEGAAELAFSMPAEVLASSLEPRISRVSQLPCFYQKESSRPRPPSSVQILRI